MTATVVCLVRNKCQTPLLHSRQGRVSGSYYLVSYCNIETESSRCTLAATRPHIHRHRHRHALTECLVPREGLGKSLSAWHTRALVVGRNGFVFDMHTTEPARSAAAQSPRRSLMQPTGQQDSMAGAVCVDCASAARSQQFARQCATPTDVGRFLRAEANAPENWPGVLGHGRSGRDVLWSYDDDQQWL